MDHLLSQFSCLSILLRPSHATSARTVATLDRVQMADSRRARCAVHLWSPGLHTEPASTAVANSWQRVSDGCCCSVCESTTSVAVAAATTLNSALLHVAGKRVVRIDAAQSRQGSIPLDGSSIRSSILKKRDHLLCPKRANTYVAKLASALLDEAFEACLLNIQVPTSLLLQSALTKLFVDFGNNVPQCTTLVS